MLLVLPQTTRATRLSDDEKALLATSHRTAVLRGRASWYGREHQGHRTSSGERFDRHKYTCAHKTLPFGTRLRVTNPDNGQAVVVRVADRGPFRHARILDLSEVAARPLGIITHGSAEVVAEVVPDNTPLGPIEAPADLAALVADESLALGSLLETVEVAVDVPAAAPAEAAPVAVKALYVVQAGTFGDTRNAAAMQAKILAVDQQLSVTVAAETVANRSLNRVVVGQFTDWATADAVRKRLQRGGITGLVRKVPAAMPAR